jgi:hypothetical protein
MLFVLHHDGGKNSTLALYTSEVSATMVLMITGAARGGKF